MVHQPFITKFIVVFAVGHWPLKELHRDPNRYVAY